MPEPSSTIALHAVGDVGFGGALRALTGAPGSADPFELARPALAGSEILFGNLETPLVGDPERPALSEIPAGFGGVPSSARWLAAAGFSIVSIANNHVMDYGAAGLHGTVRALEQAGVAFVGAGDTIEEARRPALLERGGLRIGFLAYAASGPHSAAPGKPGAAPLIEALILEDLRVLRSRADAIVVSLHFGLIYSGYPRPEDQAMARRICDAGATLILGHHPHVLQGIERRGGSLIAYSLGEFLFDPGCGYVLNRSAGETRRRSIVLRVDLGAAGASGFEIRPTLREAGGLRPSAVGGAEGEEIVERIKALSAPLEGERLRRSGLAAAAAGATVSHQWAVFLHHLAHGRFGILAAWLARARPRHVGMILRALREKLRRGRAPGLDG